MAGSHCVRAVVSFVLSDVLEDVKNESRDELRRCHLSCLQGESLEQYRSRHN